MRSTGQAIDVPESRGPQQRFQKAEGMIGILPIFGVLGKRMNAFQRSSGGASIEMLQEDFGKMVNDPDISTIVLQIDSPGGSVFGTQEFADQIYDARAKKDIIAVADVQAASGAFWIGTAANRLVVSPSGDVGSVGVFAVHTDTSEADAKDGVKYQLVKAGKYKAEGVAGPLDDEALAAWQERIDGYYESFVSAVARHRGTTAADVRKNYGEGRTMSAKKALEVKAVDRIATFDQVLSELLATNRQKSQRKQSFSERRAALAAQFPTILGGTR